MTDYSSQEMVLEVQQKLVDKGYELGKLPDGVMDAKTEDAIEAFYWHHMAAPMSNPQRVIDDALLAALDDPSKIYLG